MSKVDCKDKKTPRKIKTGKEDRLFYAIVYGVVIILTLIVLYPIIYVISASFSSGSAVAEGRVWLWPVEFSLEAYKVVFEYSDLWIGYRNTIFYTAVGTVLNVAITLICAYPMARKNLVGKSVISFVFVFTMMFGGGMIPNYLLVKNLGMTNTIWCMMIPGVMSVYNMLVARNFIQSNIADELLEASIVDGCDDYRFFFDIVLPLSKSIIAVLALWYAVGHWNSYFDAFLYLTNKQLYPLQIYLKEILVQSNIDTSQIGNSLDALQMASLKELMKYAVIVVSSVPLFAMYPFVQKHFVKGVMVGSVKG